MRQEFLEALRKKIKPDWLFEMEPMSRHTTFRVGGPAKVLITPMPQMLPEIIRLCREYKQSYYVIGNGSNLLVGDKGIDSLVIAMIPRAEELQVHEDCILAGAGVLLPQVANAAAAHGLTGMEFAAGIPGSIGGAVVMNAGAYGGEMKDIVETVTVIDANGTEKELATEELEFGYRKSCIPSKEYIVTSVKLKLAVGEVENIRARMKELNDMRKEKQPLEYPSAGSTFKRPEGYFAGKLIMDAGLRGKKIGGAQVSEKHCGFVINRGEATAKDISLLMQEVSQEVEKQFGITLEPEVKMIGEFE